MCKVKSLIPNLVQSFKGKLFMLIITVLYIVSQIIFNMIRGTIFIIMATLLYELLTIIYHL